MENIEETHDSARHEGYEDIRRRRFEEPSDQSKRNPGVTKRIHEGESRRENLLPCVELSQDSTHHFGEFAIVNFVRNVPRQVWELFFKNAPKTYCPRSILFNEIE